MWARCASVSASAPPPAAGIHISSSKNNNNNNASDLPKNNLNLALFGPPGSGKGSYGKHFAKALGIPLVTTSDVLRNIRPDLAASMSDGKLVDDEVVGETILEGLRQQRELVIRQQATGYVLDGFPRTLRQVALMEDTWPESLKISSVVHLKVPDFVCSAKLLGRRACSKCGRSYNVHGVHEHGWVLPPHLPPDDHVCESVVSPTASSASKSNLSREDASCDWKVRRDDDTPEIVGERLRIYHRNADPILNYIRDKNTTGDKGGGNGNHYRLLTLSPYRGFDDIPGLVEKLHRHVNDCETGTKKDE